MIFLTCCNVVDDGRFRLGRDDFVLDRLGELYVVLIVERQLTLEEVAESPKARVRSSPRT